METAFGPGGVPPQEAIGNERDPLNYRRRYATRVAYVDGFIGRVLQALRQHGLEENTIVALTADHGELLGEHEYYFQHCITLYEPVLHVPLVLAGPGLPAGETVTTRVSTVDLMPTLLDQVGLLSRAGRLDGRSLCGLARGSSEGGPAPRYGLCRINDEWSVTQGPYKYTQQGEDGGAAVLIDLDRDPGELHNLLAQEPAQTNRMRELLNAFQATAPGLMTRYAARWDPEALTEEHRRQLHALGYV
jgi:arylsulfatase